MFVSGTTEFYIDIHTRKCFPFRYESISATGTQKIKFLNFFCFALKHNAGRPGEVHVARCAVLVRERNKKLSIGQLDLRREVSRRQEELKDKLFVEVRDKLANFMETREYLDLLEKQIGAAKKVAGDEAMIVYMDPSDEDKARRLAMHHNVTVKISEYSFDGGIRAVIPSKHILIDSSFKTKLEEARHEFKFDLGGKQ